MCTCRFQCVCRFKNVTCHGKSSSSSSLLFFNILYLHLQCRRFQFFDLERIDVDISVQEILKVKGSHCMSHAACKVLEAKVF